MYIFELVQLQHLNNCSFPISLFHLPRRGELGGERVLRADGDAQLAVRTRVRRVPERLLQRPLPRARDARTAPAAAAALLKSTCAGNLVTCMW